jgi:hypothetical protein
MLADRGGSIRESVALGRAYAEARREGGPELIEELLTSPPSIDPAAMGAPELLREQASDRIREAIRTVEEKATPQEVQAYRDFILRVADVVAHAHKEGGVLGIGGKEVSDEERAALDQLAAAVGAPVT